MPTLALICAILLCAANLTAQPIFDYIAMPDDSFAWSRAGDPVPVPGGSVRMVDMTSQTWQGIPWRHRVAIVTPDKPRHPRMCLLVITGGDPTDDVRSYGSQIAQMAGMPLAVLGDIPNQPLFDGLTEDGLISFTFSKFLETKDPTWPALFPMTKAAVRAMDMLQELSAQEWGVRLRRFLVTGGSKRGWTTWFTGEADPRVRGIIPMVYDNLDIPAQMRMHTQQWGAYSEEIADYTKRGLPDLLASEQGRELGAMVDPYTYRCRATMPKLIICGTNDRYWPLGAANLYFDDLIGSRYLAYIPNSGHGLQDIGRVLRVATAFAASCAGEFAFPRPRWQLEELPQGLRVTASSLFTPTSVLAWTAQANTTDFRDSTWASQEVTPADGRYCFTLPGPEAGHAAAFLELHYKIANREFALCTQMRMTGNRGQSPISALTP